MAGGAGSETGPGEDWPLPVSAVFSLGSLHQTLLGAFGNADSRVPTGCQPPRTTGMGLCPLSLHPGDCHIPDPQASVSCLAKQDWNLPGQGWARAKEAEGLQVAHAVVFPGARDCLGLALPSTRGLQSTCSLWERPSVMNKNLSHRKLLVYLLLMYLPRKEVDSAKSSLGMTDSQSPPTRDSAAS